jgi:hypothetical protein
MCNRLNSGDNGVNAVKVCHLWNGKRDQSGSGKGRKKASYKSNDNGPYDLCYGDIAVSDYITYKCNIINE